MNDFASSFPYPSTLLSTLESERNFRISVPIDIERVASELGLLIENDPTLEESNIIGEIRLRDNKFVIRINPIQNDFNTRRRFTIAHEIGHYCLHSSITKQGFIDSKRTMSRSDSYWDTYESEANNFAANLLMPSNLLIFHAGNVIDDYKVESGKDTIPQKIFILRMAELFEVSMKAMEYRLKNVTLLPRIH